MKQKLIITCEESRIVSSLFEENNLVQINVTPNNDTSLLGNIYVGKVKNIVKNINAAFIEIQKDVMCYYSLEENKHPIFVNPKNNEKVTIGDDIIVQVIKENIKTKAPVVSSNLNLTGKYSVLTHGKTLIGVSNKISDDTERMRLRNIVNEYKNEDYGFILRTNAIHADKAVIQSEINSLLKLYNEIKEYGIHRTAFSLLHATPPSYICDIRDGFASNLDEIIVDNQDIYDETKDYLLKYQKEDIEKLRLYNDPMISLTNLYSIQTKLESALREKLWLKSGASIIIQPTEAFVVIDVNTGKAISGKKKSEDTFFKINMEAAIEIAKQIRLRNLSGIIIVDFIDMESSEHREQLKQTLIHLLQEDPIKTTLVDITALNLVEITRKKVRKPLHEQCMKECIACHGTGKLKI
ncbi:ribonuclease E/G [Anaeromicropila herbilytica]|uniref:Ribonuclease G n=1 Tax=Anaeromicropila herbilytica TaxID=2785025 RepID=A0A7R7ELH9_9FIRM|nr:ribonuclease E/G [Anaeromicropila herbilytica]BCN30692.1 ribonuclease G [Anaeromicropila herbilytica]